MAAATIDKSLTELKPHLANDAIETLGIISALSYYKTEANTKLVDNCINLIADHDEKAIELIKQIVPEGNTQDSMINKYKRIALIDGAGTCVRDDEEFLTAAQRVKADLKDSKEIKSIDQAIGLLKFEGPIDVSAIVISLLELAYKYDKHSITIRDMVSYIPEIVDYKDGAADQDSCDGSDNEDNKGEDPKPKNTKKD